jgi:hypothetical protein
MRAQFGGLPNYIVDSESVRQAEQLCPATMKVGQVQ